MAPPTPGPTWREARHAGGRGWLTPATAGTLLTVAALLVLLSPAVRASPSARAAGAAPVDAKLALPDGGKLRLSELRGGPLLLDFWATWCLPCREQSAVLDGMADDLAERGVAVLAVNLGEKPALVRDFLADHPIGSPVALDRVQALAAKLDVVALPTLVLLRADGTVAASHRGPSDRQAVLALLAALDDG